MTGSGNKSNSRRSSKSSSKSSTSTVSYRSNKRRASIPQNRRRKGKLKAPPTPDVGDDEDSDSESNSDDEEAFIGGGEKKPMRSEGELELEFCKRKNAILVTRRAQLERALAAGKMEATKDMTQIESSNNTTNSGVTFDTKGYPLPKGSINNGSMSARDGPKITPRNRAEVRLQDAREFSSKTYNNVGKQGGSSYSKKGSASLASKRGPSPYLKQKKQTSNGKIRRSKSSM